jgi:hypothetical protein
MASHLPSDEEIILLCRSTWSSYGRGFAKISESVFVKFGIGITPGEAATQKYFQDKSLGPELTVGYLVMEYIDGISMSTYLEYATTGEQEAVVDAIVGVLSHLATMPVPLAQGPGPVGGGPPRGYLWSDGGIRSTFLSLTDMASWLNRLLMDYQRGYQADLFDFTTSKLSMCHTDLAPRNIIRQLNGELVVLDSTHLFLRYTLSEPVQTVNLSSPKSFLDLIKKTMRIRSSFYPRSNEYCYYLVTGSTCTYLKEPHKCTLLNSK